ncbi:MAG: beta-lactamase family protein [Labilithrix sp.]|nr:beta-lactamase family protein [Labilithrix sp.]MCW5815638.1 beta-lactamase family protein [Labilithrix sp.]
MPDGAFSSPAEARLAAEVVAAGVAPDAAVGWAVRTERGWDIGHGHAGDCPDEPIFDLASLTKPLTAVAIVRSPVLRPADRLADVLEEVRGTASADATLELLLAHRAGLVAHLPLHEKHLLGSEVDDALELRLVADARRPDAVGAIPDEGFPAVYSDLGYILAGRALARATQAEDAGQAIEWLVVDALSAGRTPIELGTARSLAAQGIDFERRVRKTEVVAWRGGEVRGVVHDENAWALTGHGASGHAGMFGTAPAILTFATAFLDALKGRQSPLASPRGPRSGRESGREAPRVFEGRVWGGGVGGRAPDVEWLVRERPGGTHRAGFDGKSATGSSAGERAGPRTFGHLGFTGTSFWIDPDADAVAVLLTNRVHPTRENGAIREARPRVHDALFRLAAARAGA